MICWEDSFCTSQVSRQEDRLRNDLCVEWDVKPCYIKPCGTKETNSNLYITLTNSYSSLYSLEGNIVKLMPNYRHNCHPPHLIKCC